MSENSRLQQAIKLYRRLLLQQEVGSVQYLEDAHKQTLKAIEPQLKQLYDQMIEKMADGKQIPISWLYEAQRLGAIKALITGQISHFAALAQTITGQMQSQFSQLGIRAALALLQATVPPRIAWSFGVPSLQAITDLVGATRNGPLADLFRGFGREAAEKVVHGLITGVTLGMGPRELAPLVRDALNISRHRALTIARTEGLRAYRSANLETFRANSDVVDKWIWQSALNKRTCAACIAMHGTEHPLSEEMKAHVSCRCVKIPKTKSWDEILAPLGVDTSNIPDTRASLPAGADWFEKQSAATQQAILGPGKYAAWKNGDFVFNDIVGIRHDQDWGDSIKELPLKELVKA